MKKKDLIELMITLYNKAQMQSDMEIDTYMKHYWVGKVSAISELDAKSGIGALNELMKDL